MGTRQLLWRRDPQSLVFEFFALCFSTLPRKKMERKRGTRHERERERERETDGERKRDREGERQRDQELRAEAQHKHGEVAILGSGFFFFSRSNDLNQQT